MPTVQRLNSCKITVYLNDHMPPHFHVIANDGRQEFVSIADLRVLEGNAGRAAHNEAIAWASTNREKLKKAWKKYNP